MLPECVSASTAGLASRAASKSTYRRICRRTCFGYVESDDTNWSEGLSLVYGNGHVRGMLGAKIKGGDNKYFPQLDGRYGGRTSQ